MDADQPDLADPTTEDLDDTVRAQSSERYASMFTHHPHAAYSVDRDGYYTDANDRSLEMTGLTLQQMRQTHFSEVIHPDDVHLFEGAFEHTLAGLPQVVEARVIRADGAVIDIRCTAIPVVVGGEVVGVHGITEDVTAAKQVLRQLEEANLAKILFLSTVGHEVRTPLAALVGATDLLMDTELGPEPEQLVQLVQRSSHRLVRLVDDILEFSGLESHRTALRAEPFSLRTVVTDIAEWSVPLAESRGLTISFRVDEEVPTTVVGDALRFTQVVTNFVQNAIKFTEHGDVHVVVRAAAAPTEDDSPADPAWVEVTVTDTGIGIDHLDTLFDPFTQVDPHGVRGNRGIGLGLSISRQLVDLMGGQLRVRSALGEGSTFAFALPLEAVDDAVASPTLRS